MVSSAEMVLSDAGYGMVLTSHRDQLRHEHRLFEFLRQRRVDGLIGTVVYDDSQTVPDILRNARIPIALMERQFGDWFDSVVSDQERGCYLLTKHLLDLGHRRIGILTPPHQSRPGRDRIRGFHRAHADFGLSADTLLIKDRENRVDTGFRDSYAMLTQAHRPSAIIISVNELPGVVQAANMCELSIPHDVSIAACGDSDLAAMIKPAVTCFRWDAAKIGRYAAELLISRLRNNSDRPVQQIVLETEVVLRDSCAPPARGKKSSQAF
jgi:LacI family transcriptional regulator